MALEKICPGCGIKHINADFKLLQSVVMTDNSIEVSKSALNQIAKSKQKENIAFISSVFCYHDDGELALYAFKLITQIVSPTSIDEISSTLLTELDNEYPERREWVWNFLKGGNNEYKN